MLIFICWRIGWYEKEDNKRQRVRKGEKLSKLSSSLERKRVKDIQFKSFGKNWTLAQT